jgi:hypothetical protein
MADKKETLQTTAARDSEGIEPGFTYNELAQELVNENLLPFLNEEKEVTIMGLAKMTNRTQSSIRSVLERKVEAGELKKHQAMRRSDGQMIMAYYDPNKYDPRNQ